MPATLEHRSVDNAGAVLGHPKHCFVVIPREGRFPLASGIDAVGLTELKDELAAAIKNNSLVTRSEH